MNRSIRNSEGFTIVEIVVGLVVAGIVVPVFALILTTIISLNDRTVDTIQANGLAEKKIEAIRSSNFVALADGTYDFTDELPPSFARSNSAYYVISSVNAALKQVDLIIEYTVGGNFDRVEYTTYIGELGVGQ